MQKNKKPSHVAVVSAIVFLSMLVISLFCVPWATIHMVWGSDAYGNDILWLAVDQWNGSMWVHRANWTASGGTTKVANSQPVRFTTEVRFHTSLATNLTEANSYIQVKMNLTVGIYNNQSLAYMANMSFVGGSYYFLVYRVIWNVAGQPVGATTYNGQLKYHGYY
jgi:hypothetical protein